MAGLRVTPVADSVVKPVPKYDKLVYEYSPSPDGIDENLLILLHGFGDTHRGFAKLGRALQLPQTATLAVRAPELIPFLLEGDPEGYQWYPIHDNLGEPLSNPNPSSILGALSNFLNYLIIECNWTLERVHLFGFGQGGTVAVELARKCWTETTSGITSELTEKNCLASVVTISGPLLSYPSFNPCPTPLLIVHRPITESTSLKSTDIRALKKGFGGPGGGMEGKVVEEKLGAHREGMPASQEEWFTVMRFWADVLRQRITGEGIYHIN